MTEHRETVQVATKDDVEKNKVNAILSYLGILIIVPLISDEVKKSPFAKHHLNQGLILLIAWIVGGVVFWIPIIGWVVGIAVLVIWAMGLISAIQGDMKKLPIIGDMKIIK